MSGRLEADECADPHVARDEACESRVAGGQVRDELGEQRFNVGSAVLQGVEGSGDVVDGYGAKKVRLGRRLRRGEVIGSA